MKKEKRFVFGKNIYLLGKDEEGTKYWLGEASFDCEWYYGFGYVRTYTNNKNPERSRDINSHQHYDGLFLENRCSSPEEFKKVLPETPLTDKEIWKLNELMRTFYTMRKYMDLIYRGSSNITENDCYSIIKNETEWLRLKNEAMPALFKEIYNILEPIKEVEE